MTAQEREDIRRSMIPCVAIALDVLEAITEGDDYRAVDTPQRRRGADETTAQRPARSEKQTA